MMSHRVMLVSRRICSARLLRCASPYRTLSSTTLKEESHPHSAPTLGTPYQKDNTAETSVNPIHPSSQSVGITSGTPSTYTGRHVRIVHPTPSTTQSAPGSPWKIEFDHTQSKWLNPLMGWTSSGDTAQQLYDVMFFDSKQDAIFFAERNGYTYDVEEDLNNDHTIIKKKAYADNFKWKGKPRSKADVPQQQTIEDAQLRSQTVKTHQKAQKEQEAGMDKAKAADRKEKENK